MIGNNLGSDREPTFRVKLHTHVKARKEASALTPILVMHYRRWMRVGKGRINDTESSVIDNMLSTSFCRMRSPNSHDIIGIDSRRIFIRDTCFQQSGKEPLADDNGADDDVGDKSLGAHRPRLRASWQHPISRHY